MVCSGAKIFLSRQKSAAVGALLLCACGAGRAEAQAILPEKIATLPAFIDATLPELMDEQHVAGAAVIVVNYWKLLGIRY